MSFKKLLTKIGYDRHWDQIAPLVKSDIEFFVSSTNSHSLFLNSVSYMEHLGSRMILLSQPQSELSKFQLEHLFEEARHGYFFRGIAEKIARHNLDHSSESMLAKSACSFYLRRLEAQVCKKLKVKRGELPYLYVTAAIEIRADLLYQLWQKIIDDRRLSYSLKPILLEEASHLSQMTARISELDSNWEAHLFEILKSEMNTFERFWHALRTLPEVLRTSSSVPLYQARL